MSPTDRPDRRHRILGLALQIAAYPPAPRNKYTYEYEARVPRRLITELRAALADAGVDWHAAHVSLRETDE
jgi:hypothetical protein